MSAPTCDGARECHEALHFVDSKGYVYCEKHGKSLKTAGRKGVRILRPAERSRLRVAPVSSAPDCDGCTGDRCPGGCPILEGERNFAASLGLEIVE